MSLLHDSSLGDVTRGGQVTLHFFRMIVQVLTRFARFLLLLFAVIAIGTWWMRTTPYERYLGYEWGMAKFGTAIGNGEKVKPIRRGDGEYVQVTMRSAAESPAMRGNARKLLYVGYGAMFLAAVVGGTLLLAFFIWFWYFGRVTRAEKHLRGTEILEADDLKQWLRREGRASKLELGGIPLIEDSETTHVLVTGSPGTGKSTLLYGLMKKIRERGDRAICFSPSGDMIEWFYREGKDVLLNPFDERTPSWNLWAECTMPYHFDMIAAGMVPEPTHGDPIWNNAARSLVSTLAQVMQQRGSESIPDLLRILTSTPMEQIYEYLKHTEVAANLDPKNEKMGASIRSTASIYLAPFKYLSADKTPFNIRQWVEQDTGSDWVFLNARADQLSAVQSVLTTWLEIFTNTLMGLVPSHKRRIWLIIDELPVLNRVPSLQPFLANARKYGGCGVIAFQQLSQLEEKYGQKGAQALAGLCATWACMRQNDPETAKWIANSFGQAEYIEPQQGLSYGANDMRDGVNLSTQRKMRDIVLPSEIANLANLEGYVRLPGDIAKGHFKITRPNIKAQAEAYVPSLYAMFNLGDDLTTGLDTLDAVETLADDVGVETDAPADAALAPIEPAAAEVAEPADALDDGRGL